MGHEKAKWDKQDITWYTKRKTVQGEDRLYRSFQSTTSDRDLFEALYKNYGSVKKILEAIDKKEILNTGELVRICNCLIGDGCE